MKTQYSMVIEWSEEDKAYLVTIPEFVGQVMMPCTHGETYAEAAKHGQEVIETFVELWQDEGKALPEPRVRQVA